MSDRHVLPPYSLRMPADLREKLEESAIQGRRSLNAEIVARLEQSFPSSEIPSGRFGKTIKDHGFSTTTDAAKNWANHVSSPENRAELEALLNTILRMLANPEE